METLVMEATNVAIWAVGLLFVNILACGPSHTGPISESSFDEICRQVRGRSAAEVEFMLGMPHTRRVVFGSDERWIWWNYTFLDGPVHPPELRGRIVHLEIVFLNPGGGQANGYSAWLVDETLSPRYRLPGNDQDREGRCEAQIDKSNSKEPF